MYQQAITGLKCLLESNSWCLAPHKAPHKKEGVSKALAFGHFFLCIKKGRLRHSNITKNVRSES